MLAQYPMLQTLSPLGLAEENPLVWAGFSAAASLTVLIARLVFAMPKVLGSPVISRPARREVESRGR